MVVLLMRPASHIGRFALRCPLMYSIEPVLPLAELSVEMEYFSLLSVALVLRELVGKLMVYLRLVM